MKKMIIPLFVILSMVQFSQAKMTRLHHAHQHGSAKLGLAFDDKAGRADLKVSSSSIIGFEHSPKNGREQKLMDMQFSLLETKINDMITLAPELACVFTKDKILLEIDNKESKKSKAEHSDLVAVFNIKCAKSPIGSKITFNFHKFFPNIKDVDASVVAGDLQKSIEIKSNGAVLELK